MEKASARMPCFAQRKSRTLPYPRLFVVAKNDQVKTFYEHFFFDSSPIDPYRLFLVMKDLKKSLRND